MRIRGHAASSIRNFTQNSLYHHIVLIGFIGDIHGRVFHTIAACITWQERIGRPIDLLIQVGDLGAFPDPSQFDEATKRHLEADPSEADFSRLLLLEGEQAGAMTQLCKQLVSPIYFIHGNHEDFYWLNQITTYAKSETITVDPFSLFHYVPDGTVMDLSDLSIGFLGGAEEHSGPAGIDSDAYEDLMSLQPGAIDILVSHQGPYGSSIGFRGDIHGSPMITKLIEHLRPQFHIAGHAHCESGPEQYSLSTYLGLSILVKSPLRHPEARGLALGSLALYDTETNILIPVKDEWLADFPTPFDFDDWYRGGPI